MNTTFSFNRLLAAHDIEQTTCNIQLGEVAPVTPPAMSCERVKSPNLLGRREPLFVIHVCLPQESQHASSGVADEV